MKPLTLLLGSIGAIAVGYFVMRDKDDESPIPQSGEWTVLAVSGIPAQFKDGGTLTQVPSDADVVVSVPAGWRSEISSATQVEFAQEGTSDVALRVQEGFFTGSVDLNVFTDKGAPAGKVRVEFVQS